ncbi:hypothetical protein [Verrucomicrobium sp. BvORR106]|uniref:hypothetical protein n=1 Tax=Verrucomicrobium sp. BvORR106 TaxID=1403819 RepID=UPI002240FE08|nr:hypothetical protein [Verrucomicrobium sp. BvORR106]
MLHAAMAFIENRPAWYYLIKRGLYWRPNSSGYTANRKDAGLYTYTDAKARQYLRGSADERVTMEPAELPDYSGDLNAVREVLASLPQEHRNRCISTLAEVVTGTPRPAMKRRHTSTWNIATATALEWCIALVRVVTPGWWVEIEKEGREGVVITHYDPVSGFVVGVEVVLPGGERTTFGKVSRATPQ